MALFGKLSLIGAAIVSESKASDSFIKSSIKQQQAISLANKFAGVPTELMSSSLVQATDEFDTSSTVADLAIKNSDKPNDALKAVQQGTSELQSAVQADKSDADKKLADAQKQINQWAQKDLSYGGSPDSPAQAPAPKIESVADLKPKTTDAEAADAIKSYEVQVKSSTPKTEEKSGQTQQQMVEAALSSPMPMDIEKQLKESNGEADKLAKQAEDHTDPYANPMGASSAQQQSPSKPNAASTAQVQSSTNQGTSQTNQATPSTDASPFADSQNVGGDIQNAINSLQQQRFENKAHEAVLKKIGDMAEPGKSISLTDVVDVGGEYQKKLNEIKQSEMSQEEKEKQQKAKEDAENGLTNFKSDGFRVDLTNEDGAGYIGTIYMGSEQTPVKVLFDTGSDFLAITSDLCLNATLGKQEEHTAVFDPVSLTYKNDGKDLRKCKSTAYLSQQSSSAKAMGGDDEHLDYGSAKLQGKLYTDQTCIDQNKTSCTDFEFLALYQAVGLDDTDGVLGLAVHPDAKRRNLNYVWNLKNHGLIDRAVVSFSISGPTMDDQSYATFGGMNPEQIVGGTEGLRKMPTTAYRPFWSQSVKQWALEGKGMQYAQDPLSGAGGEHSYTAIIDTGSSNIGIPDEMFKNLQEAWRKDVHDLDCVTDDNFCQVMTPCTEIAPKLKPVAFSIGGQTFEMSPGLYLHQAEGKRCQFAIHSNQLKGSTGALVLVGDTLLRHLYQVYDFENETIALGVNKHSENKIFMYDDGKRPANAPFIQTEEDNMVANAHFSS